MIKLKLINPNAFFEIGKVNSVKFGKSILCGNPKVLFFVLDEVVHVIARQTVFLAEGRKGQSVEGVDSTTKCSHPHVSTRILNDAVHLRLSNAIFDRIILEIVLLSKSACDKQTYDQELKKAMFQSEEI